MDRLADLFNVECEQALLGLLLVDNRQIDIAGALIEPRHFYDPLHQRIFETVLTLRPEGNVTPLILNAHMRADAGLRELGALSYLGNLAEAAPSVPNVRELTNVLRELFARRELDRIGAAATEGAKSDSPIRAEVAATIAAVDTLQGELARRAEQLTAAGVASEVMQAVERGQTTKLVQRVKTGLSLLDDEIGGLHGSDLIVVAGRSGMGKSALLGGVAVRAALAGFPTLVFSLEMKRHQWVERTICDLDYDAAPSPLWYSKFRTGRLTREETGRAAQVVYDRLTPDLPLEICDDDTLNIHQIASRARAFRALHPTLGLIVIDYLQIVAPAERRDRSREQEVTAIVRGCKQMAKSLDWPVLAGAQLLTKTGDMNSTRDRKPTTADIRESGAIEFEADLVLTPFRKAFFVQNRRPEGGPGTSDYDAWKAELAACANRFELLGLKNRHGRPFELELFCDMAASAIRDFKPYKPSDADLNADLLARAF